MEFQSNQNIWIKAGALKGIGETQDLIGILLEPNDPKIKPNQRTEIEKLMIQNNQEHNKILVIYHFHTKTILLVGKQILEHLIFNGKAKIYK